MTHLEFQKALEGLEIPDCVVDFRYNAKLRRFEVIATAQINGLYYTCATYAKDEWLNDTRKMNEILDTFVEKVVQALETEKERTKKFAN